MKTRKSFLFSLFVVLALVLAIVGCKPKETQTTPIRPTTTKQDVTETQGTTTTREEQSFSVTFKNGDEVLFETTVKENSKVQYQGNVPEKEETAEFTYEFAGWALEEGGDIIRLSDLEIKSETTIYAAFTGVKKSYTVTYVVEGESTEETLEYGVTPTKEDPTKEDSLECSYKFKGWSLTEGGEIVALAAVTGAVTYYAVFEVDEVFPTAFTDGIFEYSLFDHCADIPEGLVTSDKTIKLIETEGTVIYENGAWVVTDCLDLTEEELIKKDVPKHSAIVTLSDDTRYSVRLDVYAGIIREIHDLERFFATSGEQYYTSADDFKCISTYGYYIVANDCGTLEDEINVPHFTGNSYQKTSGFNGVLDGRGHTLKFTLTGKDGIFGPEIGNAIVKNVAIIFNDNQGTTANDKVGFLANMTNGYPVIDNCYIELNNNNYNRTTTWGIMYRTNGKLTVKNTIIYGFNTSMYQTIEAEAAKARITAESENAVIIHGRNNAKDALTATNFIVFNDGICNANRCYEYGENNVDGFNDAYWSKDGGKVIWKGFELVKVTFTDGETVVKEEYITQGAFPIKPTTNPTKEETATNTFTFLGWSLTEGGEVVQFGETTKCPTDTIYYAVYRSNIKQFEVTFVVDGKETKVKFDINSECVPVEATKASTAEFTYEFAGWSLTENGATITLPVVTEDVTYYAVFTETRNSYEINFYDGENVIHTISKEYGQEFAMPADPTKETTNTTVYAFAGWTLENGGDVVTVPTIVTGTANYYAKYTETARLYTVTYSVEGVTTTQEFEYEQAPIYAGVTPEKAFDTTTETNYSFAGWALEANGTVVDLATQKVTEEITYYAVFNAAQNEYTVTFMNGATKVQEGKVVYGGTPAYTGNAPTKAATAEYTYTFVGFGTTEGGTALEVMPKVTADVTYYAIYSATKNTYKVTWNIEGVTSENDVEYGTVPAYAGTPAKQEDAENTYTFKGWSATNGGDVIANLPAVAGAVTYYAVFNAVPKFEIVNVGDPVLYSTLDGNIFLPSAINTQFEDIVRITSQDKTTTYFENGAWIKSFAQTESQMQANEITEFAVLIYEETKAYQVTVKSYAGIIDELTDLPVFFNTLKDGVAADAKANTYGYYIVIKSINTPDAIVTMSHTTGAGYSAAYGFHGVLDGMGHTLAFTLNSCYLLGQEIGNNAVIKNINMEVSVCTETGKGMANFAAIFAGMSRGNGLFENVYITNKKVANYNGDTVWYIVGRAFGQLTLRNVVINDLSNVTKDGTGTNHAINASSSNVYVIWARAAIAGNAESALVKNYTEVSTNGKITTVEHGLSSQYFTVNGGEPKWVNASDLNYHVLKAPVAAATMDDVLYSTIDEQIFVPTSSGLTMADIVKITSADGEIIYYENGAWVKTFAQTESQMQVNEITEFQVLIETADKVYATTVKSYAGIIDELTDLPVFFNTLKDGVAANAVANTYGYYIVIKSINSPDTVITMSHTTGAGYNANSGFHGVLDGMGHTLNFTLNACYLLGQEIGNNAVIKNINLNVALCTAAGSGMANYDAIFAGMARGNGLIENVYVKNRLVNNYNGTTVWHLVGRTFGQLTLRNVVIDDTTSITKNGIAAGDAAQFQINAASSNVFVFWARAAITGLADDAPLKLHYNEVSANGKFTTDLTGLPTQYFNTANSEIKWNNAADLAYSVLA